MKVKIMEKNKWVTKKEIHNKFLTPAPPATGAGVQEAKMNNKSPKTKESANVILMILTIFVGILITVGMLLALNRLGDTMMHGILIGLVFIALACIFTAVAYLKSELGSAGLMSLCIMSVLMFTWAVAFHYNVKNGTDGMHESMAVTETREEYDGIKAYSYGTFTKTTPEGDTSGYSKFINEVYPATLGNPYERKNNGYWYFVNYVFKNPKPIVKEKVPSGYETFVNEVFGS